LPRNAIYTSTKSPAWEIKKDYTCKGMDAQTAYSGLKRIWKVTFLCLPSDTLTENKPCEG
jgi:hypothetical protein